MIRVALAGPMGSGKSTVGAALAARVGVPFVDLDARVGGAAAIFAAEGEAGFRRREQAALAEAVAGEGVLALGGGSLVDRRNRALLEGWELLVLDAPVEHLRARLGGGGGRPLAAQLEALIVERADSYAAAGASVDATLPVAEVVALLERRLARPFGRRLRLSLGYDVVLARGFAGLGAEMAGLWSPRRALVVSNDVVGPLYGEALLAELRGAGWDPVLLELPDGEEQKRVEVWSGLVDRMLAARVDRRTPVVALGGGVVGDMAGFAAATVLRGLPLVQVPTTLLAMVDSSVGGKTGINTRQGKNLLGAFHQPSLVWAPFSTLRTLPVEELRSGLGEVVKHGILAGEAELARLETLAPALARRDADALAEVVSDSVRTKAAVVEEDPLEKGRRATLNLGHTAGHAIEAVAGYGQVRHGEAVAMGLLAICRWAEAEGRSVGLAGRVEALVRKLGLRTEPGVPMDLESLREAATYDKKRDRAMVTLVIPVAAGDVRLEAVPLDALDGLLRQVSLA